MSENTAPMSEKRAAVSYVEREDGKILCVWNQRYGCWAMPGGLVEAGETDEGAQARELREETGLLTASREVIFSGHHDVKIDVTRGSFCVVFRVVASGTPTEREEGSPVTWLSREQFLRWTAFSKFYERMFLLIPMRGKQ